jgi:hypothetical protein
MATDLATIEPIRLPDPHRPGTLPSLPEWAERLKSAVRIELQMTGDKFTDLMVLPPDLMPSAQQREMLTHHRDSLRSSLLDTPAISIAAETKVATAVTRLRSVLGGARNSELGEEGAAETYLVVLDDVPCWAVEAAAWKWLKHDGGTDERGRQHDYRFAPDPGTLRAIALRIAWEFSARVRAVQRVLDARQFVDCSKQLADGRAAMIGLNKAIKTRGLEAAGSLTFDEAVRFGSSNETKETYMPALEAAE